MDKLFLFLGLFLFSNKNIITTTLAKFVRKNTIMNKLIIFLVKTYKSFENFERKKNNGILIVKY